MNDGLRIAAQSRELDGAVTVILQVQGEIDLGNAAELEAALDSPAAGRARRVILDLAEVPFMDSSGLRVLLSALSTDGRELALALPPDSPVLRLLELAEVSDRVRIHDTAAEAIEGAGAESPDRA